MKEITNIIENDEELIREKTKTIKNIIKSLESLEPPKDTEKNESVIKDENVKIKEKEVEYVSREYTPNELKWKEVFNSLSGVENE